MLESRERPARRREIGGFCGLELPIYGNFPQKRGVYVNSGRSAFEYLLRALGEVQKIYLPLYTCHSLGEKLDRLGIAHEHYLIDDKLEIAEQTMPSPGVGEYVLYTDYFGVKFPYARRLRARYAGRLIIDNALALFSPPLPQTPTFYSPRKFSGLPDGGVACVEGEPLSLSRDGASHATASFLLQSLEEGTAAAAQACEENECRLARSPLAAMSRLTERLMAGIDYDRVARRRERNFDHLNRALGPLNKLAVPATPRGPFCYPFRTNLPELRNFLIDRGIYIPVLWPHLLDGAHDGGTEAKLAHELLPLPVDQRYGREEMESIVEAVAAFMRGE